MIKVCNFDASPPIAASSSGWGSSLSAKAKALGDGFEPRGLTTASGCFEDAGLFSLGVYSLMVGLLFRRLPKMRKAMRAAMSAPAAAQPIPIPAAAPFETPFDEEWWVLAVVFDVLGAADAVLEVVLEALFPSDVRPNCELVVKAEVIADELM